MTKPNVSLARWADLGGAFVTAPSSGLRDTGFQDGTPADADIVNYEVNQLYQWALYLSNGALEGDFTVAPSVLSFVDFVYTASSTTDLLAKVAHGLHTGYGPVRTSNGGGGLPAGLAAATDYWVIAPRGDADHFYLATSLTNALAGVFIDLTTNGTGTQTLLHQSTGSQVGSVTVAGRVQQAVQTETVPLLYATGYVPGTSIGLVLPAAFSGTGGIITNFPNGLWMPFRSVAGRTIVAIRALVADNTAPCSLAVDLATNDPAVAGGLGNPPFIGMNEIAGALSTGSAGTGFLELVQTTGLSVLLRSGINYYIGVRLIAGTTPAAQRVFQLEYDWV